jgi:hypothetical protein
MTPDNTEKYLHHMCDVLCSLYTIQAVRPACHWGLRPRVLAWFRVLMVLSLVKPPASAGPLSRIGDYLLAAQGLGLVLWIRRRRTFPHASAFTRGPPYPLFHRRQGRRRAGARQAVEASPEHTRTHRTCCIMALILRHSQSSYAVLKGTPQAHPRDTTRQGAPPRTPEKTRLRPPQTVLPVGPRARWA